MRNRIKQTVKDNPVASALVALVAVLAPASTTLIPEDQGERVAALEARIEILNNRVDYLERLINAHAPGITVENPGHK